jgi:glycosyltransferase involved in cell wall biosynthesis
VVLCSGGLALKLVRMLRRLARTARRRKPPSVGATDPAAIGDGAAPLADELRRSGLFDTAWYVRHAGPIPEGEDPVDHYVRVGMTTGITPQPCFDPEWYLSRPETPKKLETSAFVHFVRRGAARGVSPHPLFDAQRYLLHHPDSITHPGGPLGHYLKVGWLFDAQISAMVDRGIFAHGEGKEPEVSRPPFATFAGEVHDLLARTAGHEQLERTSKTFDQPASDSFVSEILAAYERVREEPPLVSIVIPTKNRVQGVVEAVRSVLRQTYRHWQLIVVDDGSVDDTMDVLSTLFVDPRIELVHRPIAGGVSVARNAGLARARGSYVAYLDSDNTWEPRFLEIMVAFVRTTKLRFSYAVSELREQTANGRVGFRAVPFDREALQERNYIDCIVVLHERSLLDEVGGFDEDLRRNVDWDLFIRMAAVTDFGLVPFVATRYDPWEQRHDRITITEPFGYRHKVLAKHLVNWAQAADPPSDRKAGTVSIIITVSGSAPFLREMIERVLQCSGPDVDIVVVDAKLSGAEATVLQYLSFRHPRVHVRRERFTLSTEVARNLGAATVRSEVVVFLTADVRVEPGWLDPLVSPIRDRTAAACQPLVLRPDGTDCSDAWHRPTSRLDDVTLSLRGVAPYRTNPQHINLLWVISHSQDVTARELRTFDAVFAASPLLAERLTSLSGQQVATLLQCTDQRRFRPVAPDLHRRHEVLFVGNARGVRDSVGTALKAGIVPTVYGVRWDGLLPARAWAGDYIPNEELPAVYRAAGVVLNDHWLDMRESGVISNRLFDLAACGARIVSDRVAGLEEVFGESVLTYGTPETLAAAVLQHLNETAERREAREEAAERVRRDHTFDARADQLLDSVTRLMSHPEKSPHVSVA